MSTYAVQGETLGLIADAIRGKLGTDEPMEVSSMASLVESIPSGGSGYTISDIAAGAWQIEPPHYYYSPTITGDVVVNVGVTRQWALAYTSITSLRVITNSSISGYGIQERLCSFCQFLEEVVYTPEGGGGMGNYAFFNCPNLKTVKITKYCKVIASNAFQSCNSLTDIYVSWSAGEVANAPWGATNATIHYNTVFDDNGNIIS